MDGMLSQEEINALLSGAATDAGVTAAEATNANDALSSEEQDAIGEIANISMGSAATTLFSLVNNKVIITTPQVSVINWNQLMEMYDRPCVFIQILYREGLQGNNVLILQEKDVKIITDLMMGGDGTNIVDELSDLHLSAICEAMNQMMGAASTAMSSMLNRKIDISPPTANLVDLNDATPVDGVDDFLIGDFVRVSFKMEIGDLVDSEIMQLYPIDFAKELYQVFSTSGALGGDETSESESQQAVAQTPPPQPEPQPQQMMQGQQGMPMQGAPMPGMQMPYGQPMMQQGYGMPPQGYGIPPQGYGMPPQDMNVQPVQFQAFNQGMNPTGQPENIDLIMDVPLEVTVELGRTSKSIKEILDFAPGTIIELDKLAGEPIDVLVNGKFVAKGEVVVIDESFGIRVTDIIK